MLWFVLFVLIHDDEYYVFWNVDKLENDKNSYQFEIEKLEQIQYLFIYFLKLKKKKFNRLFSNLFQYFNET